MESRAEQSIGNQVGLTSTEAARRLAHDGPNEVVPESRASGLRRLLQPLADPMVLLLLVAAPIYLAIGHLADAIVVLVALVPIAGISWLLESRSERALEQLRELTAPAATVVRDGQQRTVVARELVVDDLVWLHEGDVVPADAMIVDVTELHADESALTGESLPVSKHVDDPVYAGTTVRSGRALARVTETGVRTRYGEIGLLVARTRPHPTPLQHAVLRLVRVLVAVAATACLFVIALERARGASWGAAAIAGISLAIATMPTEFPMVYTLYLALGARRLARDRALVRKLPSVETLGATTVICVDKTGTLTEGRLAVAEVAGPDERVILETAVMACEPRPFDPLDIAILEYARARDIDVDALHAGTLERDYPFDPVGKYLSHVWARPDGSHRIAAKGSPEGLAGADDEAAAHSRLAASGLRVIAVSGGRLSGASSGDRVADEAALRPLGLIAFADPVRDGVDDALTECRSAGIRVVMITGDHPATAHAVAEGLHLPHESEQGDVIVTGEQIDGLDEDGLDAVVEDANIYARTRPDQKQRLVHALRRRGEVVAMTGDGVNDAPALREADIGVAMGSRGTAVARESAAMVLLDDNFATIVHAVRDGRRIFESIRRAFLYLFAFHPPLLLAALVVPILDRPLLLLPVHLILLQLLLQPIVSLVFETDPPAADLMARPPRKASAGFVGRQLARPLLTGTALGIAVVTSYLVALRHLPVMQARAFAFVVLLTGELFTLFVVRGLTRRRTPVMRGITGVNVALIGAVVLFPPLATLLKLAPFPAALWPLAIAIAAVASLWAALLPNHEHRKSPGPRVIRP